MTLDAPILIPFLVPIGIVIVMVILQLLLLLVAGIGFDFDFDHGEIDVDVDLDADVDIDSEGFSLAKFLNPIGLGYIPLSIIWYTYGLSFGVVGIITTFVLAKFNPVALWFLAASIPISIFVGWHITKYVVRFIAPLFKTTGVAEDVYDLVGRSGKITSLQADENYGEITISLNGTVNHMIVKTNGETLLRGATVVVTNIDPDSKRPIVTST